MALRLSCKITGVDTAIKKLQNFGQAVDLKAKRRVNGTSIDISGYAADNCPVRTHRLRSSIHAGVEPNNPLAASVTAGSTDVKYAPPVEFGHKTRSGSTVPAHPFMRPAAQRGSQEFPEKLMADIQDAINEVSR